MPRTILAVVALIAIAADYARPELLIEPTRAESVRATREAVILDVRPRKSYDARHVAGAVWVDIGEWMKSFGDGKDGVGWSKRIAAVGVTADRPVVVYDEGASFTGATAWWILRYWGVKQASMINGGWPAWQRAEAPTSDQPTTARPGDFVAVVVAGRRVDQAGVLTSLPGAGRQIIDARSLREHCGLEKLRNKRAGAIPSAKHLEWKDLFDADGRVRKADDLMQVMARAGIQCEKPSTTYCQAGGRAAVMAFCLELMGCPSVENYYAGWGEWGNADDTPVVVPRTK